MKLPTFGLDKYVAIGATLVMLAAVSATVVMIRDSGKRAMQPTITRLTTERDKWHGVAETWQRAAEDWERSFRRSERLRADEARDAIEAVNGANAYCERRVERARKSAFSIASLLNKEPKRDESHCPIRALLPAGELRDAIEAPAG